MEGDDLGALARRMQEELGLADGKPVSGDAAVRFLAQASSLSHAAASAVCSHMLDAGVLVTVSKPRMGIGRRRAPAPTKFRADSTLYRIHPGGNATVTNPLVAAASSAGAAQSELGGSGDVGPGPVSGSPRARSSDGAQSHASSGRWSGSASSVSNSPRGGPALGGAGAASDAFARDEEAEYALSIEPAQVLESGKRFEGFLEKRGNAIFADWRRRWAVLSGSVLGYFEDCDEATALGVIDLAIPDVALHWGRATNAKYKRRLVFEIQNPKRTYAFQASDVDDLREWLCQLQAQLQASQQAAFSMQMRVCRRLCSALDAEGLLNMASAGSALTVQVKKTARKGSNDPSRKYEFGEELGSGNFGRVRLVTERATGEEYAMKVIPRPKANDARSHAVLREEIQVLERLTVHGGHPNVIALKEVLEEEETIFLILELASGGQLMDAIASQQSFNENDARGYMRQIVAAVQFMHRHRIVHRDMKPENVQLSADARVKLLDFGFAACLPDREDGLPALPEHCERLTQAETGSSRRIVTDAGPAPAVRTRAAETEATQAMGKRVARLRRLRGRGHARADNGDSGGSGAEPQAAEQAGPKAGQGAPAATAEPAAPAAPAEPAEPPPLPYDERLELWVGTRYAVAPEIWAREPYTRAVDVWGIGIILYMLLVGKAPFSDFGGAGMLARRVQEGTIQKPEPQWSTLSSEARDLIGQTLSPDPRKRPTAAELLGHPWFALSRRRGSSALREAQSGLRRRSMHMCANDPKALAELAAVAPGSPAQ